MFVRVIVCAALVEFTLTLPKSRLRGEKPTGATPVPDNESTIGLPIEFELRVIAPLTVPIAFGAKVT